MAFVQVASKLVGALGTYPNTGMESFEQPIVSCLDFQIESLSGKVGCLGEPQGIQHTKEEYITGKTGENPEMLRGLRGWGPSSCSAAKHRLHCMRPRVHRFLQGCFPQSVSCCMRDWRSADIACMELARVEAAKSAAQQTHRGDTHGHTGAIQGYTKTEQSLSQIPICNTTTLSVLFI